MHHLQVVCKPDYDKRGPVLKSYTNWYMYTNLFIDQTIELDKPLFSSLRDWRIDFQLLHSFTHSLTHSLTCWVATSAPGQVPVQRWFLPSLGSRMEYLYFMAVYLTAGVVRPWPIATTTKYVHVIANGGCRMEISPSGGSALKRYPNIIRGSAMWYAGLAMPRKRTMALDSLV